VAIGTTLPVVVGRLIATTSVLAAAVATLASA